MRVAIPLVLIAALAAYWLAQPEPGARSGKREPRSVDPVPVREVHPEEKSETGPDPTTPSEARRKSVQIDPVEAGPAALELEIVNRGTHQPAVWLRLELWRLDAPGNENWTAGDQCQARVRTSNDGTVRIENLPEGRYRVICAGAAQGSSDPPAFEVLGAMTRIRLEVPLPDPIPTYVKVFDETGNTLGTARRSSASRRRSTHFDPPEWMRPRRRRNEDLLIGMGGGVGGSHHRPYVIHAGPEGFDLGKIPANTRRSTCRTRIHLYFDSRSTVRVEASGDPAPERIYAAISPPAEFFLRAVVLPDDYAGKPVTGHATVTPVEASNYATLLRRNLKVELNCPGFKALAFDWCPAEPLPPLALEPEQ